MALKSTIAEMLGGSPFQPLKHHMASVMACVDHLPRFVEAVIARDWASAATLREAIADGEHEADRLKKALRRQLPSHLFMAVDRRDLLDMLLMQDKVANKAKDIAGLMLGRRMEVPAALEADFRAYVQRTIDACHQAHRAIRELDALLDTGFRGRETALVGELLSELDRIEHETDRLQVKLREQLLTLERDLPPVDVIFFYQIIDWIGDLADRAQRVGARLQVMVSGGR
jgi:uncharacterized protein